MPVDFFDTTFYDKESAQYSGKRYNTAPRSYVQFFFQERLRHVINLVGKHAGHKKDLTIIEDGCADGVVVQMVYKKYRQIFSKVIGTDLSPGMIEAAKKLNQNPVVSFSLKSELPQDIKADVFLAVGFVSPGIFADEFSFIRNHLKKDGIVIMSLVAKNSIHARLKLKGKEIVNDYRMFAEYEKFLETEFEIIDKAGYGFFVPKLWAVPAIARVLQPVFEIIGKISPSLFHETLYVLKEKR
jgi:SAM-dependent methyltransferase